MKFLFPSTIALSAALSCFSQVPDTNKVSRYMLLNEVVISASKQEEPQQKVPQQITVLEAKDIRELSPPTTADLLSGASGIFVQKSQQGGGDVTLRGFSANRLLLCIDGVRMNNLIYRSGHLQNIITVDPLVLERVEVLYGPASTIYGSDALGGVIHMVTKDPALAENGKEKVFRGSGQLRYASANNGMSGHVQVMAGGRKLGTLTACTYNKFGDLRMGGRKNPFYGEYYGERPYYVKRFDTDSMVENGNKLIQRHSGYEQVDILQKIIFRPSAKTTHRLNLQYSQSTDIPRYDRLTEWNGNILKYAEWYYGPQIRLMSAYDLKFKGLAAIDHIQLNLAGQYLEESRHTRKFNQDFLTHRSEYVGVFSGSLDLLETRPSRRWNAGLSLQVNWLKSRGLNENIVSGNLVPVDSRYPDGKNHMSFIEAYLSHRWDMGKQTTFSQGVRLGLAALESTFSNQGTFDFPFTGFDQNNFTWSGSLGLVHSLSDRLKLTANLASSYRVPNVDDISKIFERPKNTLMVPNSDLKPEQTFNLDLGMTYATESGLRWENVVFGTLYRDMIAIAPSTWQGEDSVWYDGALCQVLASQNKEKAAIAGLSSSFHIFLGKHWSAGFALHYTYGRVLEDDTTSPMSKIPPLSGEASLAYERNSFRCEIYSHFNGWKPLKAYYLNGEDNEVFATPKGMPAWITYNIRISRQFGKIFEARAALENILDTQYRVFASGISAPGRNLVVTLRVNW